ncbi:MAG: hypothetical protein APF77_11115 [Clostridia bacterium BRH_c25]|nr:MAG: hypothetical protein APF77_11115 [Clostridia bacterium BRH_c25]
MASISGISTLRFSGLATGIDVDSMVEQIMKAERMKMDKIKQDKQLLEWKQDDYRSITNLMRGFRDSYFDVLSSTNMRSTTGYKAYSTTITPSDAAQDTGAVTAVGTSTAVEGTHSIIVKNLATAQVRQSAASITKDVQGDSGYTLTAGETFRLSIDGVTKTITLSDLDGVDGVTLDDLNKAIENAFGSGKVTVDDTTNPGMLTFKASSTTNGVNRITVSAGTTNNALANMGFGAGAVLSNRLNNGDTLAAIQSKLNESGGGLTFTTLSDGTTQGIKLTINNKTFEFSETTTLYSMMNQINQDSTANVSMQYDEVNDKFKFTAKQTGAGNNIDISESGSSFIAAAGITAEQAGEDALITVDGTDITRGSNTFTVSGITYTALKETGTREVKVSISQNVDAVFDKIKGFVDKYNELISKINGELSEKRNRDYLPLTDEQKAEMSDDDIKRWEEKAMSGMLRGDPLLEKIASDLRSTLYAGIEGESGTSYLFSIGIETGDWSNKGKLVINETKLRDALKNSPELVTNIFAKESSIAYSPDNSSADRATRFKENGIISRMYDIIQDNIRTIADKNGQKGALLEKAGVIGETTEIDNLMYGLIKDKEKMIETLTDKLIKKENNYYLQFSAMETAISKMNTQVAWLTQQMGG